jgi:hypothetical protein
MAKSPVRRGPSRHARKNDARSYIVVGNNCAFFAQLHRAANPSTKKGA